LYITAPLTRFEIDRAIREAISDHIDPETCQAWMIRARRRPVEATVRANNQVHVIDQEQCS